MTHTPKIFLIDIETSPLTGYCWGTYDQNVIKVIEPSRIISMAWKELGKEKMYCKALPDFPGYQGGIVDDESLVRLVWSVIDAADIIISQNGIAFDLKKLNARFVYYNLPAPSSYQNVDTLKAAKKFFRFDSNSLNSLASYLEEGQKAETGGFELWVQCMAGDKAAWAKMKKYNCHDVELLERIYLRLRPYIGDHPKLSVIADNGELSCDSCLSHNIVKRGFSLTLSGRKQRFQCNDCGSWSTGKYERTRTAYKADEDEH